MTLEAGQIGVADELIALTEQIDEADEYSLPLMIFHSTKSEIFSLIFNQEYSVVGLDYPTFFFYGKPSFFCQFSDKLNRMTLALPLHYSTSGEFTLHDSDLSVWPNDMREIFMSNFGQSPLTIKGDFVSIQKAASFIFGGNRRYFDGTDACPRTQTSFLLKFVNYIKVMSSITTGQVEKARTIELKSQPIAVDDKCIVFLVEPNKNLSMFSSQEVPIPAQVNLERDSALALIDAAEKAYAKKVRIVSCLDQRPNPSSLESLYDQLFFLVRKNSTAQLLD